MAASARLVVPCPPRPAQAVVAMVAVALACAATGCSKDKAKGGPDAAIDAAVAIVDAGSIDGSADGAAADLKDAGPDAAIVEDVVPSGTEVELTQRARHLLEAVVQDNADLATDMLFPRDAYSIAREGDDPGKTWERRVLEAYKRDVHVAHKRLRGSTQVTFVGFELGHTLTQITPTRKEWKRPLWRVRHSKLTYTVEGKNEHLDIDEMVGWRGAWYVVKVR